MSNTMTGSPTLPRLRSSPTKRLHYDSPLREDVFKGKSNKASSTPMLFTMGQVFALVALGASLAAILTAVVSVHSFSSNLKAQADALSAVAPGRRLRPIVQSNKADCDPQPSAKDNTSTRKVVWLMSFPNRFVRPWSSFVSLVCVTLTLTARLSFATVEHHSQYT